MQLIDLQNVPNQAFSITLNNVNYRFAVRTIQDLTFISVWRNDEVLFYNQICVPNGFIDPYNYVSDNGKIFFRCLDEEYPNYKRFGITQWLYYMTKEEVEEYEKA